METELRGVGFLLRGHQNGSLKQWIESEVDKRMSWKQIQEDLRLYKHSAEPDIILRRVTSLQHCDEKILKGPDLTHSPYLRRGSAESLARAYTEMLPPLFQIPKLENYPEWITYRQAGDILNVKSETIREYAKPRRGWLEPHLTLPRVSSKSVFARLKGEDWRKA